MQFLAALPVWLLFGLAMLVIKPLGDGPLAARCRQDRYAAAMLFSSALLIYSLTLPGLTTTLDEDIAAATRALVRGRTFQIDAYSRSFHDASHYDGHFYSHKNPATSFLTAPFYVLGRYLGRVESIRKVDNTSGKIHIPSSPFPQIVLLKTERYPAQAVRLIVWKTAAHPENLMLLDAKSGLNDALFDGKGNPVEAFHGAGLWTRTDSNLAWPAQAGGIELPLTLDLVGEKPGMMDGVGLYYSGLYPEMVATVAEVQIKTEPSAEWQAAVVNEIRCVSWVERQRQLSALGTVLCAAVAVVLVYCIARRLDADFLPAVMAASIGAFASLHWRYAIVLYNHAPLAAASLGMLHATIAGHQDADRRVNWAWKTSLWMGFGLLTDTVFALPLAIGLAAWGWIVKTRPNQQASIVRAVAGSLLIALVLLGAYQWRCFGAPWRTPNQYSFDHEWLRSVKTAFDYPLFDGLRLLLLGNGREAESQAPPRLVVDPRDYRGLFVAEPVLILAVAGLLMARNRRRFEMVLMSAVFVSTLVAMAMFHTPWGGGDEDTRYLYHVAPILYVGAALWLDSLWCGQKRISCRQPRRPPFVPAALWLVTGFTVFLGLRQSWEHLGEGLGRWDNVWLTGSMILPALPKPLCPVSLWITLPMVILLIGRVYVTTKPIASVSVSDS